MHIVLSSKTPRLSLQNVDLPPDSPPADLFRLVALQTALPVSRLRLTTALGPLPAHSLRSLSDGQTVFVKDLGPQVSWRTVFVVEYLGPLLIHPLFYFYSPQKAPQKAAFLLVMLHFLKREYESLFVHRFSSPTMPLLNIFKNSAHYHLLCGLNLAYWIYRPRNTPAPTIAFCVALWTFAQISNFLTHLALKNLRPQGSTQRKIPSGYGFDLVSCPNYFFEFLAWLSFSLLTRSWAAHLFLVVSTAQMYLWAAKKHQRYKTEFKHYPKSRKAMFPFIA